MDLAFAPAHMIAAAVRRREVSPVDVVAAALARIERLDPALGAFVALRPEAALAEARALAERIARGDDPGPLAGVPFGVKDLEDLAGMPTTHGSVPFRGHVAARDSTQVARLRRAGAIPLGKTNTPEFGYTALTRNRLFGVTRNPWNLARTPGGSSGGSAAAVAAGLVPLSTASDGGGSIRIPASYVGAFGLKPTFGRVPRGPFGFLDWIDTTAYGPLTRCVADAALFLDVVAGPDAHDPGALPHPGGSWSEGLDEPPRGLRVAYSPTLGYARVAADVARVVDTAVTALGRVLGCEIAPHGGRFTDVGSAWGVLNAFELRTRLDPLVEPHRKDWGHGFLATLEFGARVGQRELAAAQQVRLALVAEVAELFARWDFLVTPTLPTVAFAAEGPLPAGVDGRPFESPMHVVAFTYPFNMTAHPACTVRAGFATDGMPVGLQLVAARGREDLLLRAARAWELAQPAAEWPEEPRHGA
ncbi:MAG TPA: amidase family protein [Candidatus Binatia bacterium]|nr:amidase family protein [Candidatus Binatia bacterium]